MLTSFPFDERRTRAHFQTEFPYVLGSTNPCPTAVQTIKGLMGEMQRRQREEKGKAFSSAKVTWCLAAQTSSERLSRGSHFAASKQQHQHRQQHLDLHFRAAYLSTPAIVIMGPIKYEPFLDA
ncbi:hypothetical protein AJ80_08532 [Polytolypa hystricis UAMH7299]|uniref:Uncharacterized protein n=1 Tax=Polytolypa hystricis (strain UAMH7299) TaxID=1447883 RepID=A0A2B7X5Z5_POLH7|nr:hypothetical protein AJ80_08532 [Polytolypa hystricis UAMH7299]